MDAVVVGSGPNGLAAAIALARAGLAVRVLEAADTPGGATRSEMRTLPGFVHDVGSAVHPMALASPFFRSLPLERHGLRWVRPEVEAAHPLDDGRAVALLRDVGTTAERLGEDGTRYRDRVGRLRAVWDDLLPGLLAPPTPFPRRPHAWRRFAPAALRSASGLARAWFSTETARALFAGMAAHSVLPLDRKGTAGIGLTLLLSGHAVGWAWPRGGARKIADALVAHLVEIGGTVECGRPVRSMRDLPDARAYLFDVAPRNLRAIAGERFPRRYRRRLARFRHGPGAFKIDWALAGPIPWTNPDCRRAGTVHVGGTLDEIEASEAAPWRGEHAERPFVLLVQPTVFDPTRAPSGRHVAWAYVHVPHGSDSDRTDAVERQVERFAPGFRDLVLGRSVATTSDLEAWDPNLVGGDVGGGVQDLAQTFFRPRFGDRAYATPDPAVFLCSASTPPGGGVHGMCGWNAARVALRRVFGRGAEPLNSAPVPGS